jgi:hypothetical protein
VKDFLGNELIIGDAVATNIGGYTYSLEIMYVIGFTEQKIKVSKSIDVGKPVYLKFPRQIVKI